MGGRGIELVHQEVDEVGETAETGWDILGGSSK
jgi:hypothetical protein